MRAAVPRVGMVLQFLHQTGSGWTWPGLLLLIGAIGYAIRLRYRSSSDSDDNGSGGEDDDDNDNDPDDDLATQLRATGADLAFCAEQLRTAKPDPRQALVIKAIAEHAAHLESLANDLFDNAPAETDDYAPRHGASR